MDDEQGREGRMVITDVKGNSFVVEPLERRSPGVVDEHKLANIGEETYEEIISNVMVHTHEQAIARFILGKTAGLKRDPIMGLQDGPPCLN